MKNKVHVYLNYLHFVWCHQFRCTAAFLFPRPRREPGEPLLALLTRLLWVGDQESVSSADGELRRYFCWTVEGAQLNNGVKRPSSVSCSPYSLSTSGPPPPPSSPPSWRPLPTCSSGELRDCAVVWKCSFCCRFSEWLLFPFVIPPRSTAARFIPSKTSSGLVPSPASPPHWP